MEEFRKKISSHEDFKTEGNHNNDIKPKNVKKVLEECYFIISDLKVRNKILEDTVEQKNATIQKLIKEKQEQLAYNSHIQTENLKKQLAVMTNRCQEIKNSFQAMMEDYEKITKKLQTDINKLKSFNKVLRIQNNQLRSNALHQTHYWREREKKIGKITQSKCGKEYQNQNKFEFTVNHSEGIYPKEQIIPTKLDTNTPQKFNTSKSVNLSTAARSISHHHFKESSSKRQSIPRNLFNNPRINEPTIPISQPEMSISGDESVISFKEQTIGIWFSRLKKLLDQSDDES